MNEIKDIDIKLLSIFKTVAKYKSFAKAAEFLNTSPSNISMNMGQLESRLKMRLCERGASGFRLTQQGEEVLEASKTLNLAFEAFKQQIKVISKEKPNEIRLGLLSEIVLDNNLPVSKILSILESKISGVRFHLEFGQAIRLEELVLKGDLDYAFGYFPQLNPSLTSKYLFTDRQLCYCGKDHELFSISDNELSPEHLQNYQIAGYDDFGAKEENLSPILSNYDSCSRASEGILALILTGNYIGLIAERFVRPWVEKGEISQIKLEGLELFVDFHMIYQSNKVNKPLHNLIVEVMRKFYPDF